MAENKVRVQLKAGLAGGEFHTTTFDLVLKPGQTVEVTEEQFQRLLLGAGVFEAVGDSGLPPAVSAQPGQENVTEARRKRAVEESK